MQIISLLLSLFVITEIPNYLEARNIPLPKGFVWGELGFPDYLAVMVPNPPPKEFKTVFVMTDLMTAWHFNGDDGWSWVRYHERKSEDHGATNGIPAGQIIGDAAIKPSRAEWLATSNRWAFALTKGWAKIDDYGQITATPSSGIFVKEEHRYSSDFHRETPDEKAQWVPLENIQPSFPKASAIDLGRLHVAGDMDTDSLWRVDENKTLRKVEDSFLIHRDKWRVLTNEIENIDRALRGEKRYDIQAIPSIVISNSIGTNLGIWQSGSGPNDTNVSFYNQITRPFPIGYELEVLSVEMVTNTWPDHISYDNSNWRKTGPRGFVTAEGYMAHVPAGTNYITNYSIGVRSGTNVIEFMRGPAIQK